MQAIDSSVLASVVVKDYFYDKFKGHIPKERATGDTAFANSANAARAKLYEKLLLSLGRSIFSED